MSTLTKFKFTLTCLLFAITGSIWGNVVYDKPITVEEYSVGFKIKWSTIKEIDCRSFVVERSFDGKEYKEVGTVVSEGKYGRGNVYQFNDLELGLEKAYYRLRQVSNDGSFRFTKFVSKTKSIVHHYMVTHKEKVGEGTFEITVQSIKEGELLFRVNDMMGEIIQENKQGLSYGLNTMVVNLEFEAVGNYIATLKLDNELETVYLQRGENQEQKKNVASKGKKGRG